MFGGIIYPVISHLSWKTSDQQSLRSGNGVRETDDSVFSLARFRFFSRKFWTYFRRILVHRNAFKQMRYRRHHTLHWYSKRPQEDDFM